MYNSMILKGLTYSGVIAILFASLFFMQTHLETAAAEETIGIANKPVNILAAKWKGPFDGVPAFDKVKTTDFVPAFEQAMNERLKEIDAIANARSAPTFKNTIVALERSGQMMKRVSTYYYIWSSSMNTPEFGKVRQEMAPKLAAFSDKITQNEALFKRIESVNNSEERRNLRLNSSGLFGSTIQILYVPEQSSTRAETALV